MEQLLQVTTQGLAVLRVGQRELDERLEVGVEVADVVAPLSARQPDAVGLAPLADEGADRVGELNLSALAGRRLLERVEDRRREDVPGRDREVAGGLVGGRL